MTSTIRPALKRWRTSRHFKTSIWRAEMCTRAILLFAAALAFASSAAAAPVMPFTSAALLRTAGWAVQSDHSGLILVQRRGGGAAGGGAQRPAARANRSGGGFNSN